MDQKTFQFHREKLSIFTLKPLVFWINIQPVLFLIKTSKTRHCFHLDGLNFKKIENFFCIQVQFRPWKTRYPQLAWPEYMQDPRTICQALNVILISQMLWGTGRALLCQRFSRNYILLFSWLADFLITSPFRWLFLIQTICRHFFNNLQCPSQNSIRQKIPAIYTAVQT